MSRAAVFTALTTSSALSAEGLVPTSVFGMNAVETYEGRPFAVIDWRDKTPAFSDRGTTDLQIWVYDDLADYARIDRIIELIKTIFAGMTHVAGGDGRIITQADWSGDSGDLFDDVYGTIVKTTSFRVLSRTV